MFLKDIVFRDIKKRLLKSVALIGKALPAVLISTSLLFVFGAKTASAKQHSNTAVKQNVSDQFKQAGTDIVKPSEPRKSRKKRRQYACAPQQRTVKTEDSAPQNPPAKKKTPRTRKEFMEETYRELVAMREADEENFRKQTQEIVVQQNPISSADKEYSASPTNMAVSADGNLDNVKTPKRVDIHEAYKKLMEERKTKAEAQTDLFAPKPAEGVWDPTAMSGSLDEHSFMQWLQKFKSPFNPGALYPAGYVFPGNAHMVPGGYYGAPRDGRPDGHTKNDVAKKGKFYPLHDGDLSRREIRSQGIGTVMRVTYSPDLYSEYMHVKEAKLDKVYVTTEDAIGEVKPDKASNGTYCVDIKMVLHGEEINAALFDLAGFQRAIEELDRLAAIKGVQPRKLTANEIRVFYHPEKPYDDVARRGLIAAVSLGAKTVNLAMDNYRAFKFAQAKQEKERPQNKVTLGQEKASVSVQNKYVKFAASGDIFGKFNPKLG